MDDMMTDEDMLGYVMDLLEPAERRAVEHYLMAHPEAAQGVERLRAQVAVLAVDREPPLPPPGLAVRAVSRVAAYVVEHEPFEYPPPEGEPGVEESITSYGLTPVEPSTLVAARQPMARAVPGWLRADVFVTAGIGVLLAGLVVSGISRTRHQFGITACANNLQTLHKSLVSYSDAHDGQFPQVGNAAHPTAGTFAAVLAKGAGDPTRTGFTWHCPANRRPDPLLLDAEKNGWNDRVPDHVEYAYNLGYRDTDGRLAGLRRTNCEDGDCDQHPIAADLPSATVAPGPGPVSPHRQGQNVLYVGGHVRFLSHANAGIDGDDIYRNREGRVAAGLHQNDSTLGRPSDRP